MEESMDPNRALQISEGSALIIPTSPVIYFLPIFRLVVHIESKAIRPYMRRQIQNTYGLELLLICDRILYHFFLSSSIEDRIESGIHICIPL